MSRLAHFRDALGFDRSRHIPFSRQYAIRCSQCEALVINGTPTHEHGCPNQVHECRGCNAVVDALLAVDFPSNGAFSLEYEENPKDPIADIKECFAVANAAVSRVNSKA